MTRGVLMTPLILSVKLCSTIGYFTYLCIMKFLLKISLCLAALFISAHILSAKTDSHVDAPQNIYQQLPGTIDAPALPELSDYFTQPAVPSINTVAQKFATSKLPSLSTTKATCSTNSTLSAFNTPFENINPITHRYTRQSQYYIYTLRRIRI